ncbi:unnamed protein product [Adineta steineri]|uniref:DUF221-domain-containing protein n=2 Tax=Adineta steineri TaxID=433720 RepID=A0A814XYG3_9BILA|nr:unnamed protein product [Adineta steineri]
MATYTTNSTQITEGASLSQFFTTLVVSATVAIIEITIFVIIRKKLKRIYEPKTYLGDENQRVEHLPSTCCGWLSTLLKMPQEDLIRTSGLDAYFFARYLYMHAFFFLSSFVLVALILLPVYIVDGKGASFGKTGLDILTFGNIQPRYSSRYAAPLVLAYIFIGAYLYFLYTEMKVFVGKRQTFLRSPAYQSCGSATTILMTAIPKEYMSEAVLFRIFNQFPGGVKYIWLNRNLKDLPDKADERMKLVEELETTECKLIRAALKDEAKYRKTIIEEDIIDKYFLETKRPTMRTGPIPVLSSLCFGEKVDTLTYCKETISQLNTTIERAKTSLDKYVVINSAFIQFNKSIAAHMAVQCVAASIPLAMTPRYIDVKPANIVWSNLTLTYYEKKVRELAILAATIALIIFWAIPVSFVGILSNLTYLTDKLTFLRFIYNLPTALLGLITGLLPTVLLAILMALLPIVLRLLAKMSGIPTTDAIDRYVQGSYFVFQVVHAFLFVTISSSVTSVITLIIQNPPSAATILAANIPTASNFFFSFLALQGLSMAANVLLQVVVLILFYLLGTLFDNTPRKKSRRYFTLSSLEWGTIFPIFTNFVVITLVYSIIAPLILIISGFAFALFYIAYIYTIFYVADFPNDIGGLMFPRAIYQSFTGIYLMEILLAALFFLAQNEFGSQSAIPEGVLMCILIVITIGVHFIMSSSFNSLTHYLPMDAEELSPLEVPVSRKPVMQVLNLSRTNNVTNIDDATNELYDNTVEHAYMHPVLRDPKPIVWIAEDKLGIAAEEVRRTRASGLNILMSTKGARFNKKMKIEIDSMPPDHVKTLENNNGIDRTRF